ncbi:MAG: hypothetical protein JXB06_08540 [Spirochaetales bacterium]|nr:hypothetical protein [Spirochaetales bacterium]
MTTIKTKVLLMLLILTCLACAGAFAAERTSIWKGIQPEPGPRDLGIIFNTSDLLLDLEGYNKVGIGAKIGDKDDWMMRGMADLLLNNTTFSFDLGMVMEKHLWPGPASVYWGPSAAIGFSSLTFNKIDDDNWSKTNQLPLSVGCVLGVEVFVFQFLSVFVEYEAALQLRPSVTKVSTDGTVTSSRDFTYQFDMDMGNNSMFGIVIYLMRRDDSSRRDSAEQE